jgi:DNA-binding MarR family transcriptional regulator
MKPSDDIKKEIYTGKDSQTIEELAKETMLSISQASKIARDMVNKGAWRMVWRKQTRGGFLRAFVKADKK